jgi:glyoxylase-like metal-dependent hydrolase (beta-lactamase superfamily II)/8-oxo-dGTP pyrophosphatase MutT (NUDIX family)
MSGIRLAASIILVRGTEQEPEVYLVKRSPHLSFMGGVWAFPGGTVHDIDYNPRECNEDTAVLNCALRELFEETGVLLTAPAQQPEAEELQRIRQELLADTVMHAWPALLDACNAPYASLTPVCYLTTPAMSQVRYKTCFLIARLPEKAKPSVVTGELVEGKFVKAGRAIQLWEQGEIQIAPPNLFLLKLLNTAKPANFCRLARTEADKINAGALHSIYFSPGIFLAALITPTLPPATTTNTLIVGNNALYIIDPATPHQDEQTRLFDKMDEMINAGGRFKSILLTHHHLDHVGAVTAVSRRYHLPVRAHPLTYSLIQSGFLPGVPLMHGEKIDLGVAPDGSRNWTLEVVYTPGHARDHVCFIDNRYHAAIVGDMLSTVSTILIDPPEGHMKTYLNSLELLLDYPIKTLFPAHGTVHHDGASLVRDFLFHRKQRENAIIAALDRKENARTVEQLLPLVYADVEQSLHPIAAGSLRAGLIKLEEEGKCKAGSNGWYLTG